jgi:hypothetical protein
MSYAIEPTGKLEPPSEAERIVEADRIPVCTSPSQFWSWSNGDSTSTGI